MNEIIKVTVDDYGRVNVSREPKGHKDVMVIVDRFAKAKLPDLGNYVRCFDRNTGEWRNERVHQPLSRPNISVISVECFPVYDMEDHYLGFIESNMYSKVRS